MNQRLLVYLYCTAVSILTIGHLGYLLYQQTSVLQQYGEDTIKAYIHAIPTWIPFGLLMFFWPCLTGVIYGCKMNEHLRDSCIDGLFASLLLCLIVYIPFYTLQIAVYLWIDVQLYLTNLPKRAICVCSPFESQLLHSTISRCQCMVPYHKYTQFVFVNNTLDFNSTEYIWNDYGLTYNGTTHITAFNSTSEANNAAKTWSYDETKKMFIYLQLCLVLIVIRFPIWIIIQNLDIRNDLDKKWKERRQKLDEQDDDNKNKDSNIDMVSPGTPENESCVDCNNTEQVPSTTPTPQAGDKERDTSGELKDTKRSKRGKALWGNAMMAFKDKAKADKKLVRSSRNVIETCFYGFVEGADAFSFVDEILNEGHYFAENQNLTNALLFFITLTLLLPSITNFLSFDYETSQKIKFATKLGVAIVSNVPFFAIRMYLFWLYGEKPDGSENTIFLLFTIKELVTVLLVAVEIGMDIHFYRKSKSRSN